MTWALAVALLALVAALLPVDQAAAQGAGAGDPHVDELVFWTPSTGEWNSRDVPGSNVIYPDDIATAQGTTPFLGDLDGDGHDDFVVWDASGSAGRWTATTVENVPLLESETWGLRSDVPLLGDVDGDGQDDLAVWRPSTGRWYIRNVDGDKLVRGEQFGDGYSAPLLGDVDGDGDDDLITWTPNTGTWSAKDSDGTLLGSVTMDVDLVSEPQPMVGDVDGDGADDFVVFTRSNAQWTAKSLDGTAIVTGLQVSSSSNSDTPLLGDVDGDGADDFTIRYHSGFWSAVDASGTMVLSGVQFGTHTDIPLFGSIAATCHGQIATVDMSHGDQPTDTAEVIVGTKGADTIHMSPGDLICAKPGNDIISPSEGADFSDTTPITVNAGYGDDSIYGSVNVDILGGGEGNDYIDGGFGDDRLYGASGDDVIIGGEGNDLVDAGTGNDTVDGGAGDDLLRGGDGVDDVTAGTGLDMVYDTALVYQLQPDRPIEFVEVDGERVVIMPVNPPNFGVVRTILVRGTNDRVTAEQWMDKIVLESDWRGNWIIGGWS